MSGEEQLLEKAIQVCILINCIVLLIAHFRIFVQFICGGCYINQGSAPIIIAFILQDDTKASLQHHAELLIEYGY